MPHRRRGAKKLHVSPRWTCPQGGGIDGREVDFVVTEERRPVLMVECKWGDAPLAPGLRYLKARFPRCEAWEVSAIGVKDYRTPGGVRAAPAPKLLERLA